MDTLLHDLLLNPAWYFTAARGLILILIVMTIAGYSVLLERKASAWIQGRIGPNRTSHPLIAWIPGLGGFLMKFSQTGKLPNYAFAISLGVVVIAIFFMVARA